MIRIDANLFRLAYAAVSTEETRYYLNGVYIEAHPVAGAIMVSTDGHRMVVVHDPEGQCSEAAIVKLPRFALAECKSPKTSKAKRWLTIEPALPGTATVEDETLGKKPDDLAVIQPVVTVSRVVIDGTFPEWRRVVPYAVTEPSRAGPAAFNAKYLKEWGALGAEIGKLIGNTPEMRIELSDGASPAVIRWAMPNIFGIQMPMRSGIKGYLPEFMKQQPEAQMAAE